MQNELSLGRGVILKYLNIDGALPTHYNAIEVAGDKPHSLVAAALGYINTRIKALDISHLGEAHVTQCTFIGSAGGTPGQKGFYPYRTYANNTLFPTFHRPQITLLYGPGNNQQASLDNIIYWHHLKSLLKQEVHLHHRNHELNLAAAQYDLPPIPVSYKEREIATLEKLQKEFQMSNGNRYNRMREAFEKQLYAAKIDKFNELSFATHPPFFQELANKNLSDKEARTDWTNLVFSQLTDLLDILEGGSLTTPIPATVEDYDTYIGDTFADTTPLMQDLIKKARTDG
jgi:hypothetical protein